MATLRLGLQDASHLDNGTREWLLTDGLGDFAMGTVAGLRTRTYHSLLSHRDPGTGVRQQLLLALDPLVRRDGRRLPLGTRERLDGTVVPSGHRHLTDFRIVDGVPRWRWLVGDTVIERELAMTHGRPCVASVFRLVDGPGPVGLEVEAVVPLGSGLEPLDDGFTYGCLSVRGMPFVAEPTRLSGIHYREEAARGLDDRGDALLAGRFRLELTPGAEVGLTAWVGDVKAESAGDIVAAARARCVRLASDAGAIDDIEALLVHAADQFVIGGPDVIAGYPWFGAWSRDTLTSYEGLFLETRRWAEGSALLLRLGAALSEGMLPNTADWGSVEYNSVDAPLWLLYAAGRHVEVTGDLGVGGQLLPSLEKVLAAYVGGTRFGIRADGDSLVRQGENGMALTWMDARVEGRAMTPRVGKPVEVNALWVAGLWYLADLKDRLGLRSLDEHDLHDRAQDAFRRRFPAPVGLFDVVDGPDGDDARVRPNQLLAASLRHGPFAGSDGRAEPRWARHIASACEELSTPLGPRSLHPSHPDYAGRFAGDMRRRDSVYHQGTVWPWLVGAQVDVLRAAGREPAALLDGLLSHLVDSGLGSVSEVADGDLPQTPGGCPFQAWSVAELLRARRSLL